MEICHGWARVPIRLSATRKYLDVEIRQLCKRHIGPFWLCVENTVIPIKDESCLLFACKACAAYHDWISYNAPSDDGFADDMRVREKKLTYDIGKERERDGGDT